MEYVDTETTNRFYYRNELVLRVSDDKRETGKVTTTKNVYHRQHLR